MNAQDSEQIIIDNMTDKQPLAADGRRNAANYTCQVVPRLTSPRDLARALANKEVELFHLGDGEWGYGLTLKGRLESCRAVIENVTQEVRGIMGEMAPKRSPKRSRAGSLKRGRKAA
jgi:hypothetical protein